MKNGNDIKDGKSMKIFVHKASCTLDEGKVKEYTDLQSCVDEQLMTVDFQGWSPSVIVSKGDDTTKIKCGENCDYEVMIYDDYLE